MKLVIRVNDEFHSYLRGFGKTNDQIELTLERSAAHTYKSHMDAGDDIYRLTLLSNGSLTGEIAEYKSSPKIISI